MPQTFIGIDVQSARKCPFAVIDLGGALVNSGWLPVDDELEPRLAELGSTHPGSLFGVDAPRLPLAVPREWYWRRGEWRPRGLEVGHGRHCEVVIKALGLANPQWTPLAEAAPDWMCIGFRIFATVEQFAIVHEVFPSASYEQLRAAPEARLQLSFESFWPGPKDMLDAAVAALTVREFEEGRGQEVGGGDGLGTIVLPRRLDRPMAKVLSWPARAAST